MCVRSWPNSAIMGLNMAQLGQNWRRLFASPRSRKTYHGDPGKLRGCTKVAQSGPRSVQNLWREGSRVSAQFRTLLSELGSDGVIVGPCEAKFDESGAKSGQVRPRLVRCWANLVQNGQILPGSAKVLLAEQVLSNTCAAFGAIRPMLRRLRPNLAHHRKWGRQRVRLNNARREDPICNEVNTQAYAPKCFGASLPHQVRGGSAWRMKTVEAALGSHWISGVPQKRTGANLCEVGGCLLGRTRTQPPIVRAGVHCPDTMISHQCLI